MVLPMIVEKTTLSYINSLNIFVYMGAFALKSANRIFVMDMVGTFFAFKRIIPKCRSPPTINLDFKKIWIDRRNKHGYYA